MKKFTELVLHIMEQEEKLAEKIVTQVAEENPEAVLTNAVHEAICDLLDQSMLIALKGRESESEKEKPKLRLVK